MNRPAWVKCNCAHISPDKHLIDCPETLWAGLNDREAMAEMYEEARALLKIGDVEAMAEFLGRDSAERAHAAVLRRDA